MGTKKDICGQKFGKLLAVSRAHKDNSHKYFWKCECDCGNIYYARLTDLIKGSTKSCGCFWHNMKNTGTYRTWQSMIQRCEYQKHKSYHYYGGRGVSVCTEWHDFKTFMKDMGIRPDDRTLDRIDTNGNYHPSNCRWATLSEQRRNRRDYVKAIAANG